MIEAILRDAPRQKVATAQCRRPPSLDSGSDHVLVVQPVRGEPFEILYDDLLNERFGELASRELKEAPFALGGGSSRITIIQLVEGKVQRVIHHCAIPPHEGGADSLTASAEMAVSGREGLRLHVKVHDREGSYGGHLPDALRRSQGIPIAGARHLHRPSAGAVAVNRTPWYFGPLRSGVRDVIQFMPQKRVDRSVTDAYEFTGVGRICVRFARRDLIAGLFFDMAIRLRGHLF